MDRPPKSVWDLIERIRGGAQEPSVAGLSDSEKGQRMLALARTFPSLASKFDNAEAYGLGPWDAEKLVTSARRWTSDQQQVVAFLLTVWNSKRELGGAFNIVEALKSWSEGDKRALIAWALEPFSF